MSLVIIKGTPVLVWGTNNTLGAPAGSIVDSLQLTPKNGEPIDIEDGSGLSSNLVLLVDGFNAKATNMYDANKAWPVEGANTTLTISYNGANANSVPFGASTVGGTTVTGNGNATTVAYTCLVASVSPTFKKKGEQMIDLNLVYRPNVAV